MSHRYSGASIAARAGLAVAAGAGLAAGVEVATYPLWRQWCRQWGATAAEASQALPGDDLLADPLTVTTPRDHDPRASQADLALIMERKMLIGIKQGAEHLASQAKISV